MSRYALINPFTISPFFTGIVWETSGSSSKNDSPSKTVDEGDTLSQIAEDNDMSVEELAAANNISNVDDIKVGQKLDLSGAGSGSSTYNNNIGLGGKGSGNDDDYFEKLTIDGDSDQSTLDSMAGDVSQLTGGSSSNDQNLAYNSGDGDDIDALVAAVNQYGSDANSDGLNQSIGEVYGSTNVDNMTTATDDNKGTGSTGFSAAAGNNAEDNSNQAYVPFSNYGTIYKNAGDTAFSVDGDDNGASTIDGFTNLDAGIESSNANSVAEMKAAEKSVVDNSSSVQSVNQLIQDAASLQGKDGANLSEDQYQTATDRILVEQYGWTRADDGSATKTPTNITPSGINSEATTINSEATTIETPVTKDNKTTGSFSETVSNANSVVNEALSSGDEGSTFSKTFAGTTYTSEADYQAAINAFNAETGGDALNGFDSGLGEDGMYYFDRKAYSTYNEYLAAVAAAGSGTNSNGAKTTDSAGKEDGFDSTTNFWYLDGLQYGTQEAYDAAVAAKSGTDELTAEQRVYNTLSAEDKIRVDNGDMVWDASSNGFRRTDYTEMSAEQLAYAQMSPGFKQKVDDGLLVWDADLGEYVEAGTLENEGGGATGYTMDADGVLSLDGDPFTGKGPNGLEYLNGVLVEDEAMPAIPDGLNEEDGLWYFNGQGYATEEAWNLAKGTKKNESNNSGANSGVVEDANNDGVISALEAEIASLRSELSRLGGASTASTAGMSKNEIMAAINEAMKNYEGGNYAPLSYLNAFGASAMPNYFGQTISSAPYSASGMYERRQVKNRDTGELEYVNVPINASSLGGTNFRENRRAGFGQNAFT